MKTRTIQKQNVGNAGEYYIASQLSARDFIATVTLGRAERYDILAVNPKGKTLKMSVKTSYSGNNKFTLSQKDETGCSDDFFYALVALKELNGEPDFWIIPSKRMNEIIRSTSEQYFSQLGKKGQQRIDAGIRSFFLTNEEFYPTDWKDEVATYYKNIDQLVR